MSASQCVTPLRPSSSGIGGVGGGEDQVSVTPGNHWQVYSSPRESGAALPPAATCPNSDQDGGTWQNPEEDKKKTSAENAGPFSHPVYKQISMRNGEINRMTKEQLKERLGQLDLDTRGVKEVLKKRLKNFYKKQKLMKAHIRPTNGGEPHCDFLMVIDFEATCQENNPTDFKYEIIEFPIILIDTRLREVVDEFHSYVKPVLNPRLTKFCRDLTHITQSQVDTAATFPIVYQRVLQWMDKHQLGPKYKFAVVTDGPWDMARFMHKQCRISGIPFPRWARKWVNIRKAFSNFYGFRRAKLTSMLENMGMVFVGRPHSGLDDSRNIARIVVRMVDDGYDLKVNERIYAHKLTVSDIVSELSVEPVLPTEEEEEDDDYASASAAAAAGSSTTSSTAASAAAGSSDDESSATTITATSARRTTTRTSLRNGVSPFKEEAADPTLERLADGSDQPTLSLGGRFWSRPLSTDSSSQSEDSDVSSPAAAALQQLRLGEGAAPASSALLCSSPEAPHKEDVSDLLAYYALQSS